jgi:hypothetical protein
MWFIFIPISNFCISLKYLTVSNITYFYRTNCWPNIRMLKVMYPWAADQFWGRWRLTLSSTLLHGTLHSLAALYTLWLA